MSANRKPGEIVRRAVVYHNHFDVGIGLFESTINRTLQEPSVVVIVDDDGYERSVHRK